MSKRSFLILLLGILIILSCSSVNEFGKRRIGFHYEKIKPNSNPIAYNIIDTSKVYLKISTINTFDNSKDSISNKNIKSNPTYLKFYRNGRVGEFKNININDINDLNPKKAESYLYRYKKGKFIVQVYFKHPQCGECFIKETLNKISNDTIKIISGDYISTYIKKDIPKKYLIYKPEW
ncbi:hypothetical protein [Winogradskyella sp. SYSU M77433]|uniref:hypothetical protein n=1 Tax=Winogradskyella sp. SYSU M77433 TaxID=3042722 RepID=UPI002480615C|nr:hypothetical protein [Winogradskyella sp. SYSU M77433]MDH7913870.1 hypothetical protein [Winogradskyella sp. SYSU M77433]